MKGRLFILALIVSLTVSGCGADDGSQSMTPPLPRDIVDLGALVTEDLPERVWGKAMLDNNGWYDQQNSFQILPWSWESPDGTITGTNARYTLFNHGGPHVDAPNHVGIGDDGVDSYPVDAFVGPLRVVDVSHLPLGRSVSVDVIRSHDIRPGDIVLIYTAYTAPQTDDDYPHRIALAHEAAEYLAELPVRAFGTDAFNVESNDNRSPVEADSPIARVAPAHHSFLSRGIPVYEQLFNVDRLLDRESMYFVGVPLNVENGDGMMVRPVVLIY
jgi:arylformamidase